jgi:hypothetical protein
MELLGVVGQVESRFGLFRDCVKSVQDRCTVALNVSWAHKSIWTHLMVFLGYEAQLEACFGPFGDSANIKICAWFAVNVP